MSEGDRSEVQFSNDMAALEAGGLESALAMDIICSGKAIVLAEGLVEGEDI